MSYTNTKKQEYLLSISSNSYFKLLATLKACRNTLNLLYSSEPTGNKDKYFSITEIALSKLLPH
jgi:hypothetical protein